MPLLHMFTRLCGVIDPPYAVGALDHLCHNLYQRIWKLKSNAGPCGDKRKFPVGGIETAKADKLFVQVGITTRHLSMHVVCMYVYIYNILSL
jgi:hypothetical protein